MTRTSDEMAAWFYYLADEKKYSNGLKSSLSILCIYKILNILFEEKLFLPEVIYFDRLNEGIEIQNPGPEQITVQILNYLPKSNLPIYTVFFRGSTELLFDGKYQLESGILDLAFEFGTVDSRFYINSYADCWVPIDRDDNLQIDLAIDSSERLERCLDKIDREFSIRERYPSLSEESDDMYILPQKGNRIYTKSFSDLLSNNEKALKYIWSNRNIQ